MRTNILSIFHILNWRLRFFIILGILIEISQNSTFERMVKNNKCTIEIINGIVLDLQH